MFPDTRSNLLIDAQPTQDWIEGKTGNVRLISLDPSKRKAVSTAATLTTGSKPATTLLSSVSALPSTTPAANRSASTPAAATSQQPTPAAATSHQPVDAIEQSNSIKPSQSTTKFTPQERSSLYRFTSGKASLSMRMDDLKKALATVIPNECNPISANEAYVSFLHDGPGGRIGFRSSTDYSRFPPTIPCIQNGCSVMDFILDPFSKHSLICACEDGKIRIHDLAHPETECRVLRMHDSRINVIVAHPSVEGVFASASVDSIVKVWYGETVCFTANQTVHSMAFLGSKHLALSCRDSVLRVFDLQANSLVYQGLV